MLTAQQSCSTAPIRISRSACLRVLAREQLGGGGGREGGGIRSKGKNRQTDKGAGRHKTVKGALFN